MARFLKPSKEVKPESADQTVHAHFGSLVLWVFVIQVEQSQQTQSEISLSSFFYITDHILFTFVGYRYRSWMGKIVIHSVNSTTNYYSWTVGTSRTVGGGLHFTSPGIRGQA